MAAAILVAVKVLFQDLPPFEIWHMYLILSGVVFVAIVLLWLYNSLVAYRNRVDNALGAVDVMLKKRADLIPNLVETVKGYARHEATLLEQITRLRSETLQVPIQSQRRIDAEGKLSNALGQLRVSVEAYPDLKANENFLRLQSALNESEEQIAASRRAFNAAVLQLNNAVEMFPGSLVANAFGFKRRDFYEVADEDRAVPNVRETLK
jgi:LemA protein